MVTLVVFLSLDGHLVLLRALTATFKLIPPGEFFFRPPVVMDILRLSGGMFTLAVKIAAPVLCALFLIELALALMARAAPQMNLLMVGMPLKIGVGFFFMGLIFTLLGKHIENFIVEMGPMFTNLLRLGSPGLQ